MLFSRTQNLRSIESFWYEIAYFEKNERKNDSKDDLKSNARQGARMQAYVVLFEKKIDMFIT